MTAAPACRFGDRCSLLTFEDVIECVGSHSERTRTEIAERVAVLTGKSASYLRTSLSPNDGTHNLQASMLVALFEASGNVAPLRWLAERCGFGVYRLPTIAVSHRDALLAVNDIFPAAGEVARITAGAAADNRWTAAEARAFAAHGQLLITQVLEAITTVSLAAEPAR